MKKIRVLHIIKSLGRGGAEMLLPETLALHDQDKFEFHYIYFLPWKNQLVQTIEEKGRVICVEAKNNLRIIGKRNDLIQYIKKNQINLIHCHLPWAGFVGRLVFRKTKLPTLYTEHNKQERYHKITKLLNKVTFNWQTKVIAVSKDVEESIRKNIQPVIPVQTLLNGVNTEKFQNTGVVSSIKEELGIPKNAYVVGTVAVFRFQKRLVEWLEVMATVCEARDDVYGIIVGDGPLKDEIMQAHQRLGLDSRVYLVGLQTEVRPYFKDMDAFMMTSEFEGLPIALLEAMSMECAIFSTNAGGIKEVMTKKELGVCVEVEQWQDLIEPLTKFTKKEASEMGQAARAHVQEHFSLQRMVAQLEMVYEEVLND